MRIIRRFGCFATLALAVLPFTAARAQTAANLEALRGLMPFDQLLATQAGKAALAGNYGVTGAIQSGAAHQPLLLPFPAQEDQALKDAFITVANASALADGLGTSLGDAYQAKAAYSLGADGKTISFTSISPNVAQVIAYSLALSESDSSTGKYVFASGTTDGSTMVSAAAFPLLVAGTISVFDQAYPHPQPVAPACPAKKNERGNSRPFLTLKRITAFTGPDYFGRTARNIDYLCGPADDEEKSPAFPSGHTTYGYTESVLLALMVPQRYTQMIVRGAEYGNDRIVLGAHYAMDVLGGRSLALYDVAHLLANDPSYVGQTLTAADAGKQVTVPTVADFPAALATAKDDVQAALAAGCGKTVAECAAEDTSRFANAARDAAFYESTQTYGLPVVYPAQAVRVEDVARTAPEAGYLLTYAFPGLSLRQADDILTATEGPGGGFLDNGSAFGVYSRLDLYRASLKAQALLAAEAKARAQHKA